MQSQVLRPVAAKARRRFGFPVEAFTALVLVASIQEERKREFKDEYSNRAGIEGTFSKV
jgi:hypothetical protein